MKQWLCRTGLDTHTLSVVRNYIVVDASELSQELFELLFEELGSDHLIFTRRLCSPTPPQPPSPPPPPEDFFAERKASRKKKGRKGTGKLRRKRIIK
jgi:hypothetical protein